MRGSQYEIRCPVHGFIGLNDWERSIIDHPAFQRLRRIRQLAWTDEVYPGAMHTRFEHSLGVMHTATRLYDAIHKSSRDVLEKELEYNNTGLDRDRQKVRLAALLHDVGHSPFSHAGEELFPDWKDGKKYKHEHYSAAIIRTQLRDVIENHPSCRNYDLKAEDIAAFIEGSATDRSVFWRVILDGQMDADRMDYLLRDSHHLGVQYGRFDLDRIVNTIRAIPGTEEGRAARLGFSESGLHAAEGLVLARYFMFTQVYFHKTRVAYDLHIKGALAEMIPGGKFPAPDESGLEEYMKWDDWKVLGMLADGKGGEHGKCLRDREHYKLIYKSPEVIKAEDAHVLDKLREKLKGNIVGESSASKSWYKTGIADIPIVNDLNQEDIRPLSSYSGVLKCMNPIDQVFLYAKPENAEKARELVKEVEGQWKKSVNNA